MSDITGWFVVWLVVLAVLASGLVTAAMWYERQLMSPRWWWTHTIQPGDVDILLPGLRVPLEVYVEMMEDN